MVMDRSERHIASAFDRDLETIQAHIMKMGGLVEAAILDAAEALATRDEELAEKDRVRAIVNEAQAMNDVDFELSKQELAQRINIYENTKKKKALVTDHNGRGQIVRFLLSERALPILEQRVEMAGGPKVLTTTRLDSIKPAEDCRQACESTR